jgi:hypothetical protein
VISRLCAGLTDMKTVDAAQDQYHQDPPCFAWTQTDYHTHPVTLPRETMPEYSCGQGPSLVTAGWRDDQSSNQVYVDTTGVLPMAQEVTIYLARMSSYNMCINDMCNPFSRALMD